MGPGLLLCALATAAFAEERPPEPAATGGDRPGVLGVGMGYHHFSWLGAPVAPGAAVEGVFGTRGPRGGVQGRVLLAGGRTPEGVVLRKSDVGVRFELPAGSFQVQFELGAGWLSYTGATDASQGSLNLSLGTGLAYDLRVSDQSRVLMGPRVFIDPPAAGDTMPITGLAFFVQPTRISALAD